MKQKQYICNELGVYEGLGGQYHTMTNKNTIREDIIV